MAIRFLSFLAFIAYLTLLAITGALPAYAAETDKQVIILGQTEAERADNTAATIVFTEVDIHSLPGGNTIAAMRTSPTARPYYTFTVSNAPLDYLLDLLAITLVVDIVPASPGRSGLFILDNNALDQEVSFSVNTATIRETLDAAALASNCNIYLDDLAIIVDHCD